MFADRIEQVSLAWTHCDFVGATKLCFDFEGCWGCHEYMLLLSREFAIVIACGQKIEPMLVALMTKPGCPKSTIPSDGIRHRWSLQLGKASDDS